MTGLVASSAVLCPASRADTAAVRCRLASSLADRTASPAPARAATSSRTSAPASARRPHRPRVPARPLARRNSASAAGSAGYRPGSAAQTRVGLLGRGEPDPPVQPRGILAVLPPPRGVLGELAVEDQAGLVLLQPCLAAVARPAAACRARSPPCRRPGPPAGCGANAPSTASARPALCASRALGAQARRGISAGGPACRRGPRPSSAGACPARSPAGPRSARRRPPRRWPRWRRRPGRPGRSLPWSAGRPRGSPRSAPGPGKAWGVRRRPRGRRPRWRR